MEELYRTFSRKDFEILAVSTDAQGVAVTRPFQQENHLTFPILHDADYRVGLTYGARSLPMTFMIDRQGVVRHQIFGARDWGASEAQQLVQMLMNPSACRNRSLIVSLRGAPFRWVACRSLSRPALLPLVPSSFRHHRAVIEQLHRLDRAVAVQKSHCRQRPVVYRWVFSGICVLRRIGQLHRTGIDYLSRSHSPDRRDPDRHLWPLFIRDLEYQFSENGASFPIQKSAGRVCGIVLHRRGVCRRVDALRRAGARDHLVVCQHHRFDAERGAVADELFIGIGVAVVSHGPGRGSFPYLFQTGASVFVGRLHCERGGAGCRGRDDLRQYHHDDHRFLRAVWDRLVSWAVTQKVQRQCKVLSAEF